MNDEYLFVASEIRELEELLADIPEEQVIERMSLESRLQSAKKRLKKLPEHKAVSEANFVPGGWLFYGDEVGTRAGIDKLDKLRFRDFLRDVHQREYPDSPAELTRLLQNMNLVTDDGHLNLTGALLFAEQPEFIASQFMMKAVRCRGNQLHDDDDYNIEDIYGTLQDIFSRALDFVMRSLHQAQSGCEMNTPGAPEIPREVFEELLVNALMHRDYLISAPTRLFIFSDRIEIISPGHLPGNLNVEKLRMGGFNIRNPTLFSHIAKGLLPYHGPGSGITRALKKWPYIDFTDDRDGCLFTVTVYQRPEGMRDIAAREARLRGRGKGGGDGVTRRGDTTGPTGVEELSEKKPEIVGKGVENVGKEGKNMGKESEKRRERTQKVSEKELRMSEKILTACGERSEITIAELAAQLGITGRSVERHIRNLQNKGRLRRVGGRKQGHWQV